jgi:hypothetical protein
MSWDKHVSGLGVTLAGTVGLAAVSTAGDFIWARMIVQHRQVYGLIHGAVLFLCVGLILGAVANKRVLGALSGMAIGAAAAGSYYLLRPFAGRWLMFLLWFAVWIGLGAVYQFLRTEGAGIGATVARGLVAAAASGAAFYLISGIWRPNNPQGWGYAVHFGAWLLAYFPGFAALLVGRPQSVAVRKPA